MQLAAFNSVANTVARNVDPWMVTLIDKAMDEILIERKFVECRPEKVSAAVLD